MPRTAQPHVGPIRRVISFACALGLFVGGLYWIGTLFFGIENGGRVISKLVLVPSMMIALGGYWLWEDFIRHLTQPIVEEEKERIEPTFKER